MFWPPRSPRYRFARSSWLSAKAKLSCSQVSIDQEDPARPGTTLEVSLKYSEERVRTIEGIKRVSKPGLRIYAKADAMPRVLGGIGVAVLSTSKGLMTDREARKRKLGGEVLCYVW